MYGKLFESMYDGSLREDWIVMIVFQQMIILCDPDGVVDMTPEALSARTNIPLEHIAHAIQELEKPDPKSRSQEKEGRRIIRLSENRDWGWEIVNHQYYRDLHDADDKREKARIRQQRSREKRKQLNDDKVMSQNVTRCHTKSPMSHHTDTDANSNTEREKHTKPLTLPSDFNMTPEMENRAREQGITADLRKETEKFKAYHRSKGTVSHDWEAEWTIWVLRTLDFPTRTGTTAASQEDQEWKETLALAKLFRLEQHARESRDAFTARVTAANDRRLGKLGEA